MIPSLCLRVSEGITHAAVSLYEGCVALEYQRPGRQVRIVPAPVADGTRIVHHGHAEARLDRLRAGGIDVIHGKTIDWVALTTIVASPCTGSNNDMDMDSTSGAKGTKPIALASVMIGAVAAITLL